MLVESRAKHPIDITGGRILRYGDQADVIETTPHEADMIEQGLLIIVSGTPYVPPPPGVPLEVAGADSADLTSMIYKGTDGVWKTFAGGTVGQVLHMGPSGPDWLPVDLSELDFDPATQTELDAHNASHTVHGIADTANLATQADIAAAVAPIIGLQAPVAVAYNTAALATGAAETGRINMYKGYRVRRITTSRAARVRLYSDSTKRDADLARPATVDPPDYPTVGAAPDHGCMLEVITDATHLDIPLAPNVSGAELSGNNAVPITVNNLGALGAVTVTVYYQRIEP